MACPKQKNITQIDKLDSSVHLTVERRNQKSYMCASSSIADRSTTLFKAANPDKHCLLFHCPQVNNCLTNMVSLVAFDNPNTFQMDM